MITAEDLLDLMPIVADRGWALSRSGRIRDADDRCPLCSFANAIEPRVFQRADVHSAMNDAGVTGIEPLAIWQIMMAADNNPAGARLRPRLMQALGMKS